MTKGGGLWILHLHWASVQTPFKLPGVPVRVSSGSLQGTSAYLSIRKSQSRNPRCAMQVKVDAGSEHVHEAVLSLRGTGYHSWGWRSGEANRMGCGAQRCLIQEAPGILLKWRHLKGPLTWESNSVCVDNGSRKRRERGEEVRGRGKRRGEEREVGKYTCDVLSPFHDLQ